MIVLVGVNLLNNISCGDLGGGGGRYATRSLENTSWAPSRSNNLSGNKIYIIKCCPSPWNIHKWLSALMRSKYLAFNYVIEIVLRCFFYNYDNDQFGYFNKGLKTVYQRNGGGLRGVLAFWRGTTPKMVESATKGYSTNHNPLVLCVVYHFYGSSAKHLCAQNIACFVS